MRDHINHLSGIEFGLFIAACLVIGGIIGGAVGKLMGMAITAHLDARIKRQRDRLLGRKYYGE